MRFSSSIPLAVSLLAMTFNADAGSSHMTAPFDYAVAIEDAVTSPADDRRWELKQCVRAWQFYRDARTKVFKDLTRMQFFSRPGAIMVERGNSGFGGHAYVLATKKLADANAGMPRQSTALNFAPSGSVEPFTESDFLDMRGEASSPTDDASCYFTTVVLNDGSVKQTAFYDLPLKNNSSKVIQVLLPFLVEDQPPMTR
jgi:hypothetical protein